jgi:nicotinamidase/pyrazinamidase
MVTYDAATALVVVDAQNDFADPAGSLSVRGSEEAVRAMNEQIRAAAAAGSTVAYTQDWHPEHTPHFAQDGGIWPVHCVADSWGASFHPALDLVEGPVVRKGTEGEDGYSGFTVRDPRTGETRPTALEGQLRARGIERVVVVGLATDYCVQATALDAVRLGFDVTVLREAIRAVDLREGDGETAIAAMRQAGARIE